MQKERERVKKKAGEEARGPWLSDYIASSKWHMNNSDLRHNESPDELVLCSKCSHPGTERFFRKSRWILIPGCQVFVLCVSVDQNASQREAIFSCGVKNESKKGRQEQDVSEKFTVDFAILQ